MKQLLFVSLILFLTACHKKEITPAETGTLQLYLIDSPANYDHLFLDIQEVQVNHSELGWITVGPQSVGSYDILAYNNGLDTLFCTQTFQIGTITQIRLILGSNNTIVVNGVSHPITIPGSAQSGLKINVQQVIVANETVARWIDFDVAKSVVELGNGTYQLKPVLRSYNASENGIIKGAILPIDAQPLVIAIKGTDTLTAIPEMDGMFQFNGLNGNYSISFVPYNTNYTGFTLLNQQVVNGQILDLGLLSF
jgi:hypothetical protein